MRSPLIQILQKDDMSVRCPGRDGGKRGRIFKKRKKGLPSKIGGRGRES